MKTVLNKKLAEAISLWAGKVIKAEQPRLCGEIHDLTPAAITTIIHSLVADFNSDLFLITVQEKSNNVSYIASLDELSNLLASQIENEYVFDIEQLNKIGGYSIDASYENDHNDGIFELLIISWGDRKTALEAFADKRNDVELFRGN
jgi:hypothetical protein